MTDTIRRASSVAFAAALLALMALGCGGTQAKPPADVARSSLEQALNAWKAGSPPGTIAGSDPPIQAVDAIWQSGRKLESYEILEESEGDSDRRFRVRLKQPGSSTDETVLYVVLGQGPVWIYREDDYQRMLNMDNNPDSTGRKTPSRRGTRSR